MAKRRKGGGHVTVSRSGRKMRASRPRVVVSGSRFLLGDASPYRERIHRVNPVLATYLNPRRRHRTMRRRRYGKNPPEIGAILNDPMDVVLPGVVGLGAAVGVVTFGNYVQQTFLPTFSFGGPTGDILVRAAVRGGIGWAGDRFLVRGTKYVNAYRTGVVIGVVGAAILDFMGKSFTLGAGDVAQTPQSILGLGGYMRTGINGAAGYMRTPQLRGAPGVGGVRGLAISATSRLYGVS